MKLNTQKKIFGFTLRIYLYDYKRININIFKLTLNLIYKWLKEKQFPY